MNVANFDAADDLADPVDRLALAVADHEPERVDGELAGHRAACFRG